jgi:HK97 family phage portal protein
MEYGQRWFAQGASPSYLLSTDMKLGPDEVKRIAEVFMVEHSGLQSAHLPLVLDSGMRAEKISSTPDEAQYIATLDYTRSTIAAWFGLPSHLVGGANDRGNVWGKTVQEQGFQMIDFTLSGYMVPLAEAHSGWLPNGHSAAFNEHRVLHANSADLAALISANRGAGTETPNEIRIKYLDEPPIPGGDDLQTPLNSNTSGAAKGAQAEDSQGDSPGGN